MGNYGQDLEPLESHSSQESEDTVSSVSAGVSPPRVIRGNMLPAYEHPTVYDKIDEYLPLSQSISHGDLQGVKSFLDQQPDALTTRIDIFETPLEKACKCGQLEIVKELLQRLTPDQILSPWFDPSVHPISPLATAAGNGNLEIVVALVEKNSKLLVPTHPGGSGPLIPLVKASHAGHREITRYLYDKTPLDVLMDDERYWFSWLLLDAIVYGMFDIALAIFDQAPSLAMIKHPRLASPLPVLASKPNYFLRGSHLGFWRRLVYSYLEVPTDGTSSVNQSQRLVGMFLQCLPKWFGIQSLYELKKRDHEAHKFVHGVCRQMLFMVSENNGRRMVYHAFFEAVKNGNKEFVVEIIKCIPHIIGTTTDLRPYSKNMFQLAVEYRKEIIFNLIYGLDERKINLLQARDIDNNNILHTAGYVSDKEELSKVSGAALKMQRELQWFKEVESLVLKRKLAERNKKGMTPRQVFEVSHEPLRKEAEEWMKYTATVCSFVAVLIASVTFLAILTLIHLRDSCFVTFIISDTLAFFASCTSVLIFLSILTSRYSFDDFLVSLPRKMILGLTILFVSIAAMLVAFSSALFMSLRQRPMLAIPVMPFACLPAVFFLMMQYPLLKEMICATYGKGLFHRNTKRWF